MSAPPRILAIAGSDSSGGAGIQADIKTITMLGGYAMTAITAVTAQNTTGVTGIAPISAELVIAQIDACVSDLGVDAIKVGLLGSGETASAVADRLEALDVPVVFDPVLIATSGAVLADEATFAVFGRLMLLAELTTPNVTELKMLGGHEAMSERSIAYLAKGGDAPGPQVVDLLVRPGEPDMVWSADRIDTAHTHGTGCTLSTAIATGLGRGLPLELAIAGARDFVRAALLAAPGFGRGHGPMGHQAVR